MKIAYKNFLAIALVLSMLQAKATIHTIVVQNYSFAPNILTVDVGDTIEWMWESGTHTTTSTSIPPGAVAWDQQINNASVSFQYVVLTPGLYQYQCSIHVSMGMTGQFTAMNPSGIIGQTSEPYLNIDNNLTTNQLKLNINLINSEPLSMSIYNVIGNTVGNFYLGEIPPGETEKTVSVGNLAKGLYLVKLDGKDFSVTRKIVVQ
jgi:plastocyanin